jgi:hypothetical protein
MAARVTPPVQGMTDKNRAALRQFQSVEMQKKLVQFPTTSFAALPAASSVGKRLAICLQVALAVEILLVAPMRLGNLCRLEFGRHLQELQSGRRSGWLITIPGDEVKNGEPIEGRGRQRPERRAPPKIPAERPARLRPVRRGVHDRQRARLRL